ncbi:DUF2690 domain-containing protein [Amycolatopsis sp. NPDC088138]|uniref:DUF2690 domain-containing protein n=1 Tax=Amycolatopsis sp. NPDC088138 TaxID=3363938 RepID=UPI0037F2CA46
MKKTVTSLALTAAVLGAGVIAAPAASAVTCYGDYCSGKDPESSGCSADAYTVVSARIPGTGSYVELRWSPTCKTNWARTSWNGDSPSTSLRAVQCATGYTQGYSTNNGSFWWSRMIYSPSLGVSARWSGSPGATATSCS